MSRVPRRLLRAGVERSRRFVMLPSFGLSGLAVVAFVGFGFATRRRWAFGSDCPEDWSEGNRASVTGTSLVIISRRGFGWIFAAIRAPVAKQVLRTRLSLRLGLLRRRCRRRPI